MKIDTRHDAGLKSDDELRTRSGSLCILAPRRHRRISDFVGHIARGPPFLVGIALVAVSISQNVPSSLQTGLAIITHVSRAPRARIEAHELIRTSLTRASGYATMVAQVRSLEQGERHDQDCPYRR